MGKGRLTANDKRRSGGQVSSGDIPAGHKRTEVGVIPEDWDTPRLGDNGLVHRVGSGITPTGGQRVYKTSGHPFVRSQNVGWGCLLLDDLAFIDEETHSSFLASEILEGDVLLNITGASIGRCAVATKEIANGNVNQHVCEIRPDRVKLDPRFLCNFILSERGQKQIDSFQAGGNRQGLNYNQIRSFVLPLPDLPEQGAIAEALSDVDALIGALDAAVAKKRAIKLAAMQQLLIGKTRLPGFMKSAKYEKTEIGLIPKDWSVRPLGSEIEQLEAGVSVNSVDTEIGTTATGAFVLKTSAVENGRFLPYECKPIAPKDTSRAKLYPKADTILISRMNTIALVGECGYVDCDYPGLFVPDRLWMTRFRPGSQVSVRWLSYVLASSEYRQKLRVIATGTSGSMKNISKSSLLGLVFVFPSKEEQQAIASVLSDMDAEIAALQRRRDKTQAIKQGMMQELLHGKVRLV